ncbi:MAG: hypothetical protein Q7T86_00145 [Hyphomicrobiaceae bacterium]|nr:hypothetical protein [Hyphomicrobiaceae bacterium]
MDDRLVYLVAALNAIHGDGYDFSCLEESDFQLLEPLYAKTEVENLLASLPPAVAAPVVGVAYQHEVFWTAIQQVVFEPGATVSGGGATTSNGGCEQLFQGTCDFFLFKSPTCDPLAQRTVWSNHIFIYSKRQRVMVSLMLYGEGNLYRGDDGVYVHHHNAGGAVGHPTADFHDARGASGRLPRSESEEYYYDGETMHYLRSSPGGLVGGGDENSQSTAAGTADNEEWEVASGGETQKNRDFYGYS